MNQTLGTILAFVFLVGIGLFNLFLGLANLRKKRIAWGWFRLLLAWLLFGVTFWFARQLAHGLFQ